MKSFLKVTTFSILAIFFTLNAQTIYAQTVPSSSIDGVDINIDHANPAPGQNVTVSVDSYNTDLNSASIIWIVDGKSTTKGTGLTSINVTAPAIGKSVVVKAAVLTVEGKQVQKQITITSSDVDLIWESNGYVPPFFAGKALFGYQNTVKFTAMPHLAGANGKEADPRTLVYKWKENDQVLQDASGYGKNNFSISVPLPRPLVVDVQVNTLDGTESGEATLSISPTDPSIVFYQDDPLYGALYNQALPQKMALQGQEISILAVPYLFSNFSSQSPLAYTWSINNLEQPNLSQNQNITLRTSGDSAGDSTISLQVRNSNSILQGADGSVDVVFGNNSSSN